MILRSIASLVGDNAIVRDRTSGVFFDRVPRDAALPYVVLSHVSGDALDVLDGKPDCDDRTVQLDIWATDSESSYAVLEAIGDACRSAIEGFTGQAGEQTIHGCTLQRDTTLATPSRNKSDQWLRQRSMDYRVIHTNNVVRS